MFSFSYNHTPWPNSDLLHNYTFKSYYKTCEQFYRHFGIYEKSPNSFLPGLSRSIVNQFCSGGQRYSAGLRQRRGRRGRSGCRLRHYGLRGAVGVGSGAPCLTHFWPRTRKNRTGLDGNNGKLTERMAVKSTNRSRNDSDLCLRLPHNPEVAGSSPVSATRKSWFLAKSGLFPYFSVQ